MVNKVVDEKVKFTLAIVTYNEEANILRCLNSICRQNQVAVLHEIIVLDNASRDNTVPLVQNFIRSHSELPLRLIQREENHLGKARAQAIIEAKTDWVAFVDADCELPQGWVAKNAQNCFTFSDYAAIGGGNLPCTGTPFGRALHRLHLSLLGHGNSVQANFANSNHDVEHLSTCNVAYRREKVLAVGNFSADFRSVAEDLELSYRLRRAGNKLRFVSGLEVTHHHRPRIRDWAKKMFKYGRGQYAVCGRYRTHRGIKSFLPLGILLLAAVLWASPLLGAVLIGLYVAVVCLESLRLSNCESSRRLLSRETVLLLALFVVTHLSYAMGEVIGIRHFIVRSPHGL